MDMLTLGDGLLSIISNIMESMYFFVIDRSNWLDTFLQSLSLTLLEDRLITTPVNHSIPTSHPSFAEASTFI